MLNACRGGQDVTIPDLTVGITRADGTSVISPVSLDDAVGFGDVRANITNINVRADLRVPPLLNVCGTVRRTSRSVRVTCST